MFRKARTSSGCISCCITCSVEVSIYTIEFKTARRRTRKGHPRSLPASASSTSSQSPSVHYLIISPYCSAHPDPPTSSKRYSSQSQLLLPAHLSPSQPASKTAHPLPLDQIRRKRDDSLLRAVSGLGPPLFVVWGVRL